VRSDEEALEKLQARPIPPAFSGLGFAFQSVDLRAGVVCATMRPDEGLRNQTGSVHGGVLAYIADVMAGAGVIASIPDEDWCTTLDLNISYVRRFRTPPLVAEARAVHRGGRVHVWEVEFKDGKGRTLSKARATFLVARGAPV
jgi:uncharacterized protein (TIGR00369 family)